MADPVQTDARAERLAAALRANLARRKARERAAKDDPHPGESGDPLPTAGDGSPLSSG